MTSKKSSGSSALVKLVVAIICGLAAGIIVGILGGLKLAPLVGYDIAVLIYVVWTYVSIRGHDAKLTAAKATREDPTAAATDVILTVAAIVSLVAVGVIIVGSSSSSGGSASLLLGLALASVILSWAMIHTTYMLRYARLFYKGKAGGVDFNDDKSPDYHDFAYLAFTIGMTFQVSDTDLTTKEIRRTALHQALLSYLFGSVILATTINLLAGLSK